MSKFHSFLRNQIQHGGFSTEDVLVSFLPLMRQVIQTHADGRVAPLEGLQSLQVEAACVWYAEGDETDLRRNDRAVRQLLQTVRTGIDVVGEHRVVFDTSDGILEHRDLSTVGIGDDFDRPIYLPGYVCWEHRVDHHDPATDVFSLGLILASLACGLDLSDPDDHDRFVQHRRNLFRLNPALHPVLARAIVVMTELDRHQRPQDLPALLTTLQNYRDQEVDFDTDLASDQQLQQADRPGKRQVILSKLQQRLFEINRRNRLLQFRSTLQTVNLTQASIPLSFDVSKIREDQVLVWNRSLSDALLKQKPVSLNSFLNFREAVYLPGTLDRIRAEARRDETEYGFAQLRLIICFLRWADLKTAIPERYESPLLLVPVRLDVKKGIHDRYTLTATDVVAEVNPVIRHLFRQLYNIDLPDQIDLTTDGVGTFYTDLKQRIQASDASVELTQIERPRVELIHEKARHRLDAFRRRARLSGRGIRHFLDLDYSYDPVNYHPLGIRIFEQFISPAKTHLEGVVSTVPPRRRYLVDDAADDSPAVVEAEQQFYSLKNQADDNPFHWEFDLCSLTLANLRYRRMSLVRDYTKLVTENTENPAFEATFSITPVDRPADTDESPPLEERFHVVSCDPTQTQAIQHARTGHSYIIQGPPGTGKSQTITNLIADYVMRGRRVLFVCEKRAAIDVVYHRLKQQGLHELCCLIHDSQADKKQFVMDLKETYDAFLAAAGRDRDAERRQRDSLVDRIQTALHPIASFSQAMQSTPDTCGIPVRSLLDQLIRMRDSVPDLVPREWERVPYYADFVQHRARLEDFSARLKHVQTDGILAHHPLCLLSNAVADAERPTELVSNCLNECLAQADAPDGETGLLDRFAASIRQLELPSEVTSSMEQIELAIRYAEQAEFLAEADLLSLLDSKSAQAKTYNRRLEKLTRRDKAVQKAQLRTTGWKKKLSSLDTRVALQQAIAFEVGSLSFLKPSWWRLRRTLNAAYDFSLSHFRPSWTWILTALDEEHDRLADRYATASQISDEFGIHFDFDSFHVRLQHLKADLKSQSGPIRSLNRRVINQADGAETLRSLAALRSDKDQLCGHLDRFLDGYEHSSLTELQSALRAVGQALDQLPDYLHCLLPLKALPETLTDAIRSMPLTLPQLEAAAAERSLQAVYRDQRDVCRYDQEVRSRHIGEISKACDRWLQANAATVLEFVRQRFSDHVALAAKSATQLTDEEKEFKKVYNRGRREVEHEFGKSMRYKAIRELAAGDSGSVIRDLKPVWLMSPLSVSDTLPLNAEHFDVVIFDEASQITLEEAIPSLFRATQAIVVGDEMQLPPTSFFASKRDDDEDLNFEEDGEVVQYDLNSSSFLNHSSRNLPTRMLGWHYRSRSESLISFSNHAFYNGRLLTVPEERLASGEQTALQAECAADGSRFAADLVNRPVSFHLMNHGVYEKRRNTAEAEYIAELVGELLTNGSGHSIGIVAFSEAQQNEIERALRQRADDDRSFAELLDAELEREEDGQFMGLLVKNLENIQGDERDVIILSVCYGPDPDGKIRMNFGPINMSGGEKRLNVAFSRARHHMALVASMRSNAITNDYNDGANCLKNYLKYAEACSAGQSTDVAAVLHGLSGRAGGGVQHNDMPETLVDEIAARLSEQNYLVDRYVGQSHFRCDLAVYRPGDQAYRLGILTDGRTWYRQSELLERELMKPQLLQAFGWQVEVVLARDWYENPDHVLKRLINAAGR
ncbi:MAG: AAA domain-containing protein [Planctomycetaceae bacterium]